MTIFTKIKEWLSKYWFLISSAALAVLYFVYNRQNKRLGDLLQEIQGAKIEATLKNKKDAADRAEAEHQASSSAYADLKRRYDESKSSSKPPTD